jgi:4-carboxymuconolactone decarboxylase
MSDVRTSEPGTPASQPGDTLRRRNDTDGVGTVGHDPHDRYTLSALDAPTRALVRLAAIIATQPEARLRAALADAAQAVPHDWVEELILQSYLFAGFPRTLNAMREWRRLSGRPAPADDPDADIANAAHWETDGQATCSKVYGRFYDRLRPNIAALHPALDAWMIVDGYGKVLSRPALDLARRELCVMAVCAAAAQDRQLHSHLHGVLHVGCSPQAVSDALDALADLLPDGEHESVRRLWAHVQSTNVVSPS